MPFDRPDRPDHPDHLPWMDDVRDEVDRAFAVTGASTPGWPDPYPDGVAPDSTYSRCADPGKYRILETRVDAWSVALADLGLATAADVDPSEIDWPGAWRSPSDLHRVRRLDPVRRGGLSLVLATTLVGGEPFGLDVGIDMGIDDGTRPGTWIEPLPGCGCDHCDSGSADLLEELDGWVLTVARGGVVHVRDGEVTMTRTRDGSQGNGLRADDWLDEPATAPAGAVFWRGAPWWSEADLRPRSAP